MADSREPPPLFNDDDDSHKDDDNDDLFTSAVQSPVSELTTPEEPRRQEGLGDPLTSPSPAASLTPDPPSDPQAGNPTDLFESSGDPPVGGLSSVSLDSPTGGEGTQQVSSEAQDPALLHLASKPPITAKESSSLSSTSPAQEPLLIPSSSMEQDPASLSPTNIEKIPALSSPFTHLLTTFPQDSVLSSPTEDPLNDSPFFSPLESQGAGVGEVQIQPSSISQDLFSLDSSTPDIFSSPPPIPVIPAEPPQPAVSQSLQNTNKTSSSGPSTSVLDSVLDVPTSSPPLSTSNNSLLDLGMNLPQDLPSVPDSTLEVSLEDEVDDSALFHATAAPKLQLSQEPAETPVPTSSILPPMGAPLTPPVAPITPTATPNLTPSVTPAAPAPITPIATVRQSPEQVESESGDEFIEIQVSDPQKIGEGMSSYMAYKVTTKTNITYFRKKNWSVTRRFSDFLGLHGKLVEKHLHNGRIIPPAPEKSAIGTTKIKLGSDKTAESGSQDFIERRRAALERYMNRTAAHPTLRADPDFREFIELDAELPKATQTSALSSAGVLRLFNRVGETVNKMTFKMDESDQWFEEKTQQIESLDAQLRKLHGAMEGLVAFRRELAISTASFAKSTAILSSVEEHSALSRALHQLAESTERTHTIHHAQADADFYYLSETTKDYIQLIGAVKDVFHERVKTFQTWQHAQTMLAKKREAKAKGELAGRMDKVQQAQEEVSEWEAKVERSQEEFERISRAIKKEVDQFDIVRVKDFKDMIVKYLEALMTSQQQIIKVWETFMPEAKAIA